MTPEHIKLAAVEYAEAHVALLAAESGTTLSARCFAFVLADARLRFNRARAEYLRLRGDQP